MNSLPLSDHDFAAVRAEVLRRIERRTPIAQWAALAASVAVAMLSFMVARVPAVAPPLTRRSAPPSPRVAGRGALVGVESPSPRVSGEKVAEGRMRGRHHPRKPTAVNVARMEIRTADPDVRIIWITN